MTKDEKEYRLQVGILCGGAFDPGAGNYSEYEIGAWGVADHFSGV